MTTPVFLLLKECAEGTCPLSTLSVRSGSDYCTPTNGLGNAEQGYHPNRINHLQVGTRA